jgi:hypothetical protein
MSVAVPSLDASMPRRTCATPSARSGRWASWLMRSLPRMNLMSSVIGISSLAQPCIDERFPARCVAPDRRETARQRARGCSLSWPDSSQPLGRGDRPGTARLTEFAQDGGDMVADRPFRQEEPPSDLGIR